MPTKTKAVAEPIMEDLALTEEPLEEGDWNIEDADYVGETEEPVLTEPVQPVRLIGEDLLAFYEAKQQAGRRHAEIAYDAGYYSVTKAGQERVTMAQFNAAMLKAKGVDVGGKVGAAGRSHAGLTKARVSGQGILLVSQLATRHVGAEPGDVFEVSYPGEGAIVLTPTGEVKPVVRRKGQDVEEPGTPLLG